MSLGNYGLLGRDKNSTMQNLQCICSFFRNLLKDVFSYLYMGRSTFQLRVNLQ